MARCNRAVWVSTARLRRLFRRLTLRIGGCVALDPQAALVTGPLPLVLVTALPVHLFPTVLHDGHRSGQ